jgi:uncharacterized iron-regulated membrane protein
MELVAQLHGNFLLGARGSMLVELAACWAIVMILTGLYLWLPRGASGLGGLLYPRIGQRGRLFWRDLHAVTGLWVSIVALFILLSGLPWSSNWGHYLTWARNLWPVTAGMPDWPIGGTAAPAGHHATPRSDMPGMTATGMAAMSPPVPQAGQPDVRPGPDLPDLDKVVPIAARLSLPRPVWILPPPPGGQDWMISSQTQNRPLRVDYTVDPDTGAVTRIRDFAGENIVDQVVNVAIATHEGQFFGRLNQAILALTAAGLLLVSISATVMWWRRRPARTLGAPQPVARPCFSVLLAVTIAALAVLLPLFGLSLLLVWTIDRTLLRRLAATRRWLGLASEVI